MYLGPDMLAASSPFLLKQETGETKHKPLYMFTHSPS